MYQLLFNEKFRKQVTEDNKNLPEPWLMKRLIKKLRQVDHWLHKQPWLINRLTSEDLIRMLVEALKDFKRCRTTKRSVPGKEKSFTADSPMAEVFNSCLKVRNVGTTKAKTYAIKSDAYSPELKLCLKKHPKPKYCVIRTFGGKEPQKHEVRIYEGEDMKLKGSLEIPKSDFPRFIPYESFEKMEEMKNMELPSERAKRIQAAKLARVKLGKEKEQRVKELKKAQPPDAQKEPDLTELLLEAVKEVEVGFLQERSRLLRIREMPDFRPFAQYVQGVKCQAIRDLQFKENLVKERDRQEYLNEIVEERYRHLKYLNDKETEFRNEEQRKKKLFLDGLVCKIEEEEKKKGPLLRLQYSENATMRNKSHLIRQYKALKRSKEQQESNQVWRADMLCCAANARQIDQLLKEEDMVLNEIEEMYFKRKQEMLERKKAEKNASQSKKQELINEILGKQMHKKKMDELKQEIAMMRAKEEQEFKWRQEELKNAEMMAQQKKEAMEGMEKQKADLVIWGAMEIERERREAERLARQNAEDHEAYLESQKIRKRKQMELCNDLRIQIEDNERRRHEEFKIRQKEAINTNIENKAHKYFLNKEMTMEINRLRDDGLAENFISPIIRRFKIPPNMKVPPDLLSQLIPRSNRQ